MISLVAIFFILVSSGTFAQSVDEIIKKNIEAKGGYDKIKSVHSFKMAGNVTQQGMEIPFTIHQKRPSFFRLEATVQSQTMVQAYDGETAWWIFPFMGDPTPQKMPEDQAKEIIDQAEFDGHLVDYKQKGHKVEFLGKEDMEGTEVLKLKLTKKDGDVQYYYLDAEYNIELKISSKRKQGESELEVDTYLSDYKEVNGLMIAHSMESKVGGNTVNQIQIESIEMNVEVDGSQFKMPETPKTDEKK